MSVKMMGAVWELKLTAPQLIIMLALADHADDEGRNAYPSLARMAWKTGYSESTVRRILKQLTDATLLDRNERRGMTTMFALHVEKGVKKQSYNATGKKGLQNDTPTIVMTPHPYHSCDTPTPTIAVTPESSLESSGKRKTPRKEKPSPAATLKEQVIAHRYYQAYREAHLAELVDAPKPTQKNARAWMKIIEVLEAEQVQVEALRRRVNTRLIANDRYKFEWLEEDLEYLKPPPPPRPQPKPFVPPVYVGMTKEQLDNLEEVDFDDILAATAPLPEAS